MKEYAKEYNGCQGHRPHLSSVWSGMYVMVISFGVNGRPCVCGGTRGVGFWRFGLGRNTPQSLGRKGPLLNVSVCHPSDIPPGPPPIVLFFRMSIHQRSVCTSLDRPLTSTNCNLTLYFPSPPGCYCPSCCPPSGTSAYCNLASHILPRLVPL